MADPGGSVGLAPGPMALAVETRGARPAMTRDLGAPRSVCICFPIVRLDAPGVMLATAFS